MSFSIVSTDNANLSDQITLSGSNLRINAGSQGSDQTIEITIRGTQNFAPGEWNFTTDDYNYEDQTFTVTMKDDDISGTSGDDNLTLPMTHMGAEGVISVIGQSHPKQFSKMVSLSLSGKMNSANEIHYTLSDFYKPIYAEGNPVGIKACLEMLGICKAVVRLPLLEASDKIKNDLKLLLNK